MGFTMVMALITVVLLVIAVVVFQKARSIGRFYRVFEQKAEVAQGVVLDVEWFNSEVEHNTHQITRGAAFPVVEFTLPDGRVIRARTHTGRNPAPAKAGETVTVLYDPLRPEHVELKKNSGRDMMAPMYYVLAGFFAVAAVMVVLMWFLLKVVMRIPI